MSSEPLTGPDVGEKLVDQANGLDARLDRIDERLAELANLFRARIEDDASKGQLFEQLPRDLDRYREDFVFTNITRRIFTDMLQLFDRVDAALDERAVHAFSHDDF